LPTEAEEIWRYSRIGELDLDAFRPATGGWNQATADAATVQVTTDLASPAALVVVHNGRVVRTQVDPGLSARGLLVGDATGLADGENVFAAVIDEGDRVGPDDAFVDLGDAFSPGPVVIRVPAGIAVQRPVVIVHWTDGDGLAAFPSTAVQCGADSELTVVEHHASADVRAFSAPVVRLALGNAARLRFVGVQDLGPRVFSVAYQRSRVGRDATLATSAVALGGDYARLRADSRIDGKGGSASLMAAYFADGSRMHDFRTLQDHAAPCSTSDLVFKGAVQDTARSVYSGLIRVGKEAPGTNAFQTNRNLVLSDGAGAESVPNLEIETDDVRCSHASAVGPIDEEQRYYLESRGIPPEVAERLIVLGFLADVIDKIPSANLVAAIKATIAQRLEARAR